MKRYIVVILLTILSVSLYGQENPFEIGLSQDINADSVSSTIIVGNPFELKDSGTSSPVVVKGIGDNPFDIKPPVKKNPIVKTDVRPKNKYIKHFSDWLKKPFYTLNKLGLVVMLLSSVLLAVILNIERNVLSKVIQACANVNIMRSQFRNASIDGTRHLGLLMVIHVLALSVFSYQWVKYLYNVNDVKVYLLILAMLSIIYLFKRFIVRIGGFIFDAERMAEEFNFSFANFCSIIGVVLIPICILAEVVDQGMLFYVLIAGLIALFLIVLGGGVQSFIIVVRRYSNSVFHFFLYLCTFEIMPIAVLMKFIHDLLG